MSKQTFTKNLDRKRYVIIPTTIIIIILIIGSNFFVNQAEILEFDLLPPINMNNNGKITQIQSNWPQKTGGEIRVSPAIIDLILMGKWK